MQNPGREGTIGITYEQMLTKPAANITENTALFHVASLFGAEYSSLGGLKRLISDKTAKIANMETGVSSSRSVSATSSEDLDSTFTRSRSSSYEEYEEGEGWSQSGSLSSTSVTSAGSLSRSASSENLNAFADAVEKSKPVKGTTVQNVIEQVFGVLNPSESLPQERRESLQVYAFEALTNLGKGPDIKASVGTGEGEVSVNAITKAILKTLSPDAVAAGTITREQVKQCWNMVEKAVTTLEVPAKAPEVETPPKPAERKVSFTEKLAVSRSSAPSLGDVLNVLIPTDDKTDDAIKIMEDYNLRMNISHKIQQRTDLDALNSPVGNAPGHIPHKDIVKAYMEVKYPLVDEHIRNGSFSPEQGRKALSFLFSRVDNALKTATVEKQQSAQQTIGG